MSLSRVCPQAVLIFGAIGIGAAAPVFSQTIVSPTPTPSSSPSATPSPTPSSAPSNVPAVYRAQLNPINDSGVFGSIKVVIDNGTFGIALHALNLSPGPHLAYLMSGSVCSTSAQDLNDDGYVDVNEDALSTGAPAIALTVPLTTGVWPSASALGRLSYIQSSATSVLASAFPPSQLMPSPTPTDFDANLVGRVVEIRGVDAQRFMIPSSVATIGTYTAADSLPAACGLLQEISVYDSQRY